MQNYMEQSPSSLSLLFRKQSLGAFSVISQGLIFHPCCVREYSEDKLEVISGSSSPFYRNFVGFCCCRSSCSGCLGFPGRAGHRDCHNSQPRQQMGWRCQRAQPAPVPTPCPPSTCAPTERQNPKLGFQACPKNHISPTAI